MLYLAYQTHADIIAPMKAWATMALAAGHQPVVAENAAVRNLGAAYELIARMGLTHTRPAFGMVARSQLGMDNPSGRTGAGSAAGDRTMTLSIWRERSCSRQALPGSGANPVP